MKKLIVLAFACITVIGCTQPKQNGGQASPQNTNKTVTVPQNEYPDYPVVNLIRDRKSNSLKPGTYSFVGKVATVGTTTAFIQQDFDGPGAQTVEVEFSKTDTALMAGQTYIFSMIIDSSGQTISLVGASPLNFAPPIKKGYPPQIAE